MHASCGLHLPRAPAVFRGVTRCCSTAGLDPRVFPHSDTVSLDGKQVQASRLVEVLQDSLTPERIDKMRQVT